MNTKSDKLCITSSVPSIRDERASLKNFKYFCYCAEIITLSQTPTHARSSKFITILWAIPLKTDVSPVSLYHKYPKIDLVPAPSGVNLYYKSYHLE